jgi:hypothetical protein
MSHPEIASSRIAIVPKYEEDRLSGPGQGLRVEQLVEEFAPFDHNLAK